VKSVKSVRSTSGSPAAFGAHPTAVTVLAGARFAVRSATPAWAHIEHVRLAGTQWSTAAAAPTEVEPASDAGAAVASGAQSWVGAVAQWRRRRRFR